LIGGRKGGGEADAGDADEEQDDGQQQLRADVPAHGKEEGLFGESGSGLTGICYPFVVGLCRPTNDRRRETMPSSVEKAAAESFGKAAGWYREGHQACPCCQVRHCVFRSQWDSRVEYHCTECDFSAAHDEGTGRCSVTLGGVEANQ